MRGYRRRVRPTTAVAGAAALLLAAGLAACSSDPEPGSPLPTGEPVPSATGSAEPTAASPSTAGDPSASPSEQPVAAPTLPPEATTNDAAGAEAFVRAWFETVNFALATGNSEPARYLSAEECRVCNEVLTTVDEAYADGHRIDGGEYDLTEVVSPTPDGTGAVLLSVVWDQAASSEIDERGEPVDSLDGGTQVSASVILQRTDDDSSWRMFGLAL